MHRLSYYKQNIQTILASDVIARAVLQAGETSHIVSVYAESSTLEFYSVNEDGKAGTFHKVDSGVYKDFESFIQYYAQRIKGTIESSEIFSPEALLIITAKPRHFAAIADWTPRINSTNPKDYEKQDNHLRSKMRNAPAPFWPERK